MSIIKLAYPIYSLNSSSFILSPSGRSEVPSVSSYSPRGLGGFEVTQIWPMAKPYYIREFCCNLTVCSALEPRSLELEATKDLGYTVGH